jgi:C4-type Zn-finger protein
LFEQQARQMIDRADLDEEQKQNILVAMNCPCCGAGAMSFTTKLRR